MVSLIVVTLNRTAELDRLLTSLDRHTYKDFEVLVVDPGLRDDFLTCKTVLLVRNLPDSRTSWLKSTRRA